ncbi:hypothetical protein [Desulfoplanes formicivorans]|uniref:hypothetical protein n=1 Tax=Desulfoplanes formicivorans TaxID=1592317 RepID=UPI00114D2F96|nr:hypothetical protein [Desulfoplanes formicivorans]
MNLNVLTGGSATSLWKNKSNTNCKRKNDLRTRAGRFSFVPMTITGDDFEQTDGCHHLDAKQSVILQDIFSGFRKLLQYHYFFTLQLISINSTDQNQSL